MVRYLWQKNVGNSPNIKQSACQRARRANALLRVIFASVAHDIVTPAADIEQLTIGNDWVAGVGKRLL